MEGCSPVPSKRPVTHGTNVSPLQLAVAFVTADACSCIIDPFVVLPQALKLTLDDMSVTTASYALERSDTSTLEIGYTKYSETPTIVEPGMDAEAEAEAEERGRFKRRRMSSHSPLRAASPSRGHERDSGSRHRHHHRNHHRDSESASMTPPPAAQKKQRRRSDAEPDHTFRGRARNRSGSRERTGSPIFEDDDDGASEIANASEAEVRELRKRAQPPSRPREAEEEEGELRRQKSYPNLYRKDSKGEMEKEKVAAKRPHPLRQQLPG
jgi:hypothetical protein